MGVPYETPPRAGIRVNGGETVCLALGLPSRCFINKVVCVQTDGGGDDFTLELFNHASVCAENAASESAAAEVDGALDRFVGRLDERLYRVAPAFQGVAGYLEYFSDSHGGYGFQFFSQDKVADTDKARLGNSRLIYVRLSPQGVGDKTFCLVLGVENRVAGV